MRAKEKDKKIEEIIKERPVSVTKLKKTFPFLKELGLKVRQIRFIFYYVELNFDHKKAYLKAGYTAKNYNSLTTAVHELLKNVKIREGIRKYIADSLDMNKDTLDKSLVDTFYRRAFYDIAMFYSDDGSIKDLRDIPEDWRCCIDGKEEKYYGKDGDKKVEIYKLADKEKSLDRLCKYIDLIKGEGETVLRLSKDTENKLNNIFNNGKSK